MATVSDFNDLFVDFLKDIYYAEKKILKTLPKMAKAVNKNTPDLAAAFEKHRKETEGQIKRLEQVFEIIGKKASGKRCDAIEGILKEGEDLIRESECQHTLAAGLLAGAQAVEHYEVARYGTLVEWAKLLGYDDAADLLQETLDQEKKTDTVLNELAKSGVNDNALESNEEEDKEKGSSGRRKAA